MRSLTLVAVDAELQALLHQSVQNTNAAIEVAQRLAKACEKLEQENQQPRKENTSMYLRLSGSDPDAAPARGPHQETP